MKNFRKVGVIEAELGYPLRIAERYGSMEDNDYFTRRMRIQFDEYLGCLGLVEFDMKTNDEIRDLMVEFMTERLGHNAWAYIAQHKVTRRPIEDKPKKDSEVKLTTMGKAVL